MDSLSPTANNLYASMAHNGTVLPAFLVTDSNRTAQHRRLQVIAALYGLAHAHRPQLSADGLQATDLFQTLDSVMALQQSGIYTFQELMTTITEAHNDALNPRFPIPAIPTAEYPDGEPLEVMYGIDLAHFDGTLSPRQTRIWVDLLAETLMQTQDRTPWRVGSDRAEHSEPFVPGRPPEEPTL